MGRKSGLLARWGRFSFLMGGEHASPSFSRQTALTEAELAMLRRVTDSGQGDMF